MGRPLRRNLAQRNVGPFLMGAASRIPLAHPHKHSCMQGLEGGFAKFKQRYFVCDEFWDSTTDEKGPIFLYLGNEAPVEK